MQIETTTPTAGPGSRGPMTRDYRWLAARLEDRWEREVQCLTTTERGVYVALLALMAKRSGRRVTNEPVELAKALRVPLPVWAEVKDKLELLGLIRTSRGGATIQAA